MKKTLPTKQIKRWQKIDRLAFLVPVIIFLWLSVQGTGRQLWDTVQRERHIGVAAAAILILSLSTGIVALPVILLWRAISRTAKNAVIKKATFHTEEDFDYYREKLTGISPATISLLMDLQIEMKKDVTALLLKYVKMGAVSMEGGCIHVLDQELPGLMPSDKTLLSLIMQGRAQPANLEVWKKQVIEEAIKSGNLRQRGAGQKINSVASPCFTCCLSGCLLPFLLFIGMCIGAVIMVKSGLADTVDDFINSAPDLFGIEMINYFMASPDMVVAFGLAILIISPVFIMFWLPAAALFRTILVVSFGISGLNRTEAGEVLTAQIAGMKNFIRDFSNLSEAEKEQIILWDDFLIYAVVLEENERIIEDIFKMKNLQYRDFKLI